MTKTVLVPLAEGFEEMEAVIIIDVLRRAEIKVTVAGLKGEGAVVGSRGVSVIAESDLAEHQGAAFDAVVLPGGLGGTHALREDERILDAVRANYGAGRLTAALCAAPLVFAAAGLIEDRTVTAHPSVRAELGEAGATVSAERVVRDGRLLTSQGPGTAMEFALAIVAELMDEGTADSIRSAMCV